MNIKTYNSIVMPKEATMIWHNPATTGATLKRTSADGVTPVTFLATDGNFVTDLIADNYIYYNAMWKKIQTAVSGTGIVTLYTTEGSWDNFPIVDTAYQWSTMGKIRYVGPSIYELEYDDNVDINDLAVKNFLFYNGEYNRIRSIDTVNKIITMRDDWSTTIPGAWTDFQWERTVNIEYLGAGEYNVYYEITGDRAENIILYVKNAATSVVNIKAAFLGYFFDEKVQQWFDDEVVLDATKYYSDTIESVASPVSSFAARTISVPVSSSLAIPLNVPACVRYVKFNIKPAADAAFDFYLDIDENAIGMRRY